MSALGARPAIPARRDEASAACPEPIYNNHRVERLWVRLKEWRAVATLYEKTAASSRSNGTLSGCATAEP